jgi:transcriptional regulator with XRE-family HTH domain
MTESERIEFLITHLAHGSANRFADRTGMSKANVSKIKNGEIKIKRSVSKILEAYPQVNRLWLETGEGYPGDISVDFVKSYYERKLKRQEKIIDYLISRINDLENSSETNL